MNYADRDLEDYRITNMQRWGYPFCPDEHIDIQDISIDEMIKWIISLVDGNEYDRKLVAEFIRDAYSESDCIGGIAMDLAYENEEKFMDWYEEN